jgi:hypothetical protein
MTEKPPEVAVKIAGMIEASASGWFGVSALVLIVALVLAATRLMT